MNTKKRITKLSKEILMSELRTLHAKYPKDSVSALINRTGHGFSPFSRHIGSIKFIGDLLGIPQNNHSRYNQEKDMIADLRKIAVEHPEEKTPCRLIMKYGKYSYPGCQRRLGSKRMYEIVEKARKKPILSMTRYPVKYYAAPVTIRWSRKRCMWLAAKKERKYD